MLTVRIQEKNHSESIMVLKLKDGDKVQDISLSLRQQIRRLIYEKTR